MAGSKRGLKRSEVESRLTKLIPRLHRICRAWGASADVCDELVQEAVVTALDKYGQVRNADAFETWTVSIMNNCHLLYLRKHQRETCLQDDTLVDETTPDSRLESTHTVTQVRKAIAQLSDEHRRVLTLIDMEGMSYRETADVLDIRIGTVMSRLCRAREKLRLLLKDVLHKKESEAKQRAPVTSLRSLK